MKFGDKVRIKEHPFYQNVVGMVIRKTTDNWCTVMIKIPETNSVLEEFFYAHNLELLEEERHCL